MRFSGILEQTDGHFYAIEGARHDPTSVRSPFSSGVDSTDVALAIVAPGNSDGRRAAGLDSGEDGFILQKEGLALPKDRKRFFEGGRDIVGKNLV